MFEGLNYINGVFARDPKDLSFNAINPSTEEVYGSFPVSGENAIDAAVTAARKAQKDWSRKSRVQRAEHFDVLAQLIKRNHEMLRDTISIETGKNINESHAEVMEALHMCQVVAAMGRQPYGEVFASELATKDAYVIRKPRGVVLVISPWNFSLAIGAFWCAAPALVEGNTVIHKPSELTPKINQLVAQLYHEAEFPNGVFNLVHGNGTTGAALVRSNIDVVLFTGSVEVARDIKRHCVTTDSKTVSSECGSKSATIVFEDGDLDLALDVTIASAFKLSGQRCVSSSRILVQESVLVQFRDQFLSRAKTIVTGDPFELTQCYWKSHGFPPSSPPFSYGPLISEEQLQRVEKYNNMTVKDGDVRLLLRGQRVFRKGYFLTPHVYESGWHNDRPYLKEEVFGPHVALIPFKDLDDAIRIYNDTDYGLALGIVTDDYRKHREIAQQCTTGMLYINGGSIAAESHLPFSSWKKSGFGSSASATWKAVTHTMAVTINYEQGKVSWAQGMQ
jgi:aldehyde dehydrogenase (NAD+)